MRIGINALFWIRNLNLPQQLDCPFANLEQFVSHAYEYGSAASRSPSPRKLNESTVTMMRNPGIMIQ